MCIPDFERDLISSVMFIRVLSAWGCFGMLWLDTAACLPDLLTLESQPFLLPRFL